MYESFYGLREKPFKILPDPEYLFMSKDHENAYVHMEYGIRENKGFAVITGEIGCGKTTLINYLLKKIDPSVQVGLINTTHVTPSQFLRLLCQDFELVVDGLDKAEMIVRFYDFLIHEYQGDRRVVLIIDEAQNLSPLTMEEVRMLSNLQAEKHHLLQIVLVGQPQLRQKLQRPELQQFAQRVSVSYHLGVLRSEEVAEYLRHRLQVAGGDADQIFEPEAVSAIAAHSRGIPRVINIICDMAMVYGFADGLKRIGRETVEAVLQEQKIGAPAMMGREDDLLAETASAESPSMMGQDAIQAIVSHLNRLEEQVQEMNEKLSLALRHSQNGHQILTDLMKLTRDSLVSRSKTLDQIEQMNRGKAVLPPSKKRRKFWS